MGGTAGFPFWDTLRFDLYRVTLQKRVGRHADPHFLRRRLSTGLSPGHESGGQYPDVAREAFQSRLTGVLCVQHRVLPESTRSYALRRQRYSGVLIGLRAEHTMKREDTLQELPIFEGIERACRKGNWKPVQQPLCKG